jgi:hypothetical protein
MIYKNNTSWLKAVVDNRLTDAFQSAWANIINSLDGAWGEINSKVFLDKEMTFKITKSQFKGTLLTDTEGDVTITLPFLPSLDSMVEVYYHDNNDMITSENKYIIKEKTKEITLTTGNKLIVISGTCRRL